MSQPPVPEVPPDFRAPLTQGYGLPSSYGSPPSYGSQPSYSSPSPYGPVSAYGPSPQESPPSSGPPADAAPRYGPLPGSPPAAGYYPPPGSLAVAAYGPAQAVPGPAYAPSGPWSPTPPPRPAVVALSLTLAATASLQWVCVLGFCWLLATAGAQQLGTSGPDGVLFHILNRFNDRMLDGLAWPLFLFPVVSFVLSFLLLTRRPWSRLAFSATGALALLWSAWWLRGDLGWWLPAAAYVAVAVLVLWTPSASAWFRWRPPSDPARQLP